MPAWDQFAVGADLTACESLDWRRVGRPGPGRIGTIAGPLLGGLFLSLGWSGREIPAVRDAAGARRDAVDGVAGRGAAAAAPGRGITRGGKHVGAAQDGAGIADVRERAPSPGRSSVAAGLGSAIEYYDFQLYGVLAVTISPLFFPNQSSQAALLLTLAIFGGAFVVRPLGGIVFGWLGDRHGRRSTLLMTVVGMGFATALISVLPGYLAIGVLAPVLLLVLRLAQGFFAGGEVTGAATDIAECAPTARRGFFGALNPALATLGLTVATAVAGLTGAIVGPAAMAAWGWRVPFLLSVPLIAICFWARQRIADLPVFERLAQEARLSKTPVSEVVGQHFPALLKIIGLGFAQNAAGYVLLIYLNIHLTRVLKYESVSVFWLISLVTLLAVILMPFSGALSDRVGRRVMLTIALCGYIVLAPLTFYAVGLGSFPLACAAVAVSSCRSS